jgi:hypothetical protein
MVPPTSDECSRCRSGGTWDVVSMLRPSSMRFRDAASEPRRRLARRRGLSRPGTTRSRRCVLSGRSGESSGPSTQLRRLVHLAHLVFIENVLTGCPRDILGPATRVRRLVHFARPVSIRGRAHRLPQGHPQTSHAGATTRSLRASGIHRGRAHRLPRDILGPATRLRRFVHRSSPRRPPFDPRGILREQRASLNPESKTEGKIKGKPLI